MQTQSGRRVRESSELSHEELQTMARVRVHAQVGGQRRPMVGYIPRTVLNKIRRQVQEATAQGNGCVLEALPTTASRRRVVKKDSTSGAQAAWYVRLRVRVRTLDTQPGSELKTIRVELKDLLQEAKQVAQQAADRVVEHA